MKGLELCERYYDDYGRAMLEKEFPEVYPRIAAGLVGEGSECLGYDDNISTDHDFEPGFCVWLSDDDYEKYGFKMQRAYMKLPNSYNGFSRQGVNPAGGARHGVFTISEFYMKYIGSRGTPESIGDWLNIPSHFLRTATSGKVFYDGLGDFTAIRDNLLKGYPEDVRLKKLSANALSMQQTGQYNYARCVSHGEIGSAGIALCEFVKCAVSTIYLLNNVYEPFYKWAFRGLRELPVLSDLEAPLSFLLETGNGKNEIAGKVEIIDGIVAAIIEEYHNQSLTLATCNNLDTHARSIQDKIKDGNLRNANMLIGL